MSNQQSKIDHDSEAAATVFVVDDDVESRTAIEQLLRSVSINVRTYSAPSEFIDNYDPSVPACLVLDVRMNEMSGLELQRWLNEQDIHIPIIFITGYAEVTVAVEAMKAGAVDFIQKPYSPQHLLDKIQQTLRANRDARRQEEEVADIAQRLASLSSREREVADLLVKGKTTKEMAGELHISLTTADFHRRNVFEKMGVDNAVQLTVLIDRYRFQSQVHTAQPMPGLPVKSPGAPEIS